MMGNVKKVFAWLMPGIAVFVIDRIFKIIFCDTKQVLIPGVLSLNGTENTGMALGLFTGHAGILLVLSLLFAILSVFYLRKFRISGLAVFSISMIAGGALGNALDRLLYGYVIDMVEFLFVDFYIFNIADVGVVCGAILCGFSLLFRPQDWSSK